MKICFAAVTSSTLLVFATAGKPHNLRQVKSGKLSELAEDETSSDSSDLPKWKREEKWRGDEDNGIEPKWKRDKKWEGKGCSDPAGAIMDLFDCFEKEDASCASAAYDPDFELFHNTVPDDQDFAFTEEFWGGAFQILDFGFDVDFYDNPHHNQAAVRYIETVTTFDGSDGTTPPITDYPFSQTFIQHEFALIDVDDDCKLLKWDQYGDNKERTDVIEASAAITSAFT